MSRTIGMDCINLRPTVRPAHYEASLEYHDSLIRKAMGEGVSGHLGEGGWPSPEVARRLYDAWDFDFLCGMHDGLVDWATAGRCADMGHAAYAADGSDQRAPAICPFREPEEVWDFDPVAEYGLTPFHELVATYEADYRGRLEVFPEQVCTGGYYKTLISGAIQSFGWDMLLLAAADEAKFARVLERFGDYTLHHTRAWARTSIEVYVQHDDIVWTEGPFLRPDFYRRVIFPIYRELWKPLKAAGKKVLFGSDGRWDMFMEDAAACGADGLLFEPCNDLERIVEAFGGSHVLIGSKVDCRTMTFGTWEQVKAEIDATLALTRDLPGYLFTVGNHIPANVSDEMCLQYLDYLRANWDR